MSLLWRIPYKSYKDKGSRFECDKELCYKKGSNQLTIILEKL